MDMQWVVVFKDYVPLVQTLLWVILIFVALQIFYQPLRDILGSITKRIQEGGAVEAGVGGASIKLPEICGSVSLAKG
jgi:predicted tellurium resistance membrane protein TerC